MYGLSDAAATDYSDLFAKDRIHANVNAETRQNPTCNVCIQMCFYEALSGPGWQDQRAYRQVHRLRAVPGRVPSIPSRWHRQRMQ